MISMYVLIYSKKNIIYLQYTDKVLDGSENHSKPGRPSTVARRENSRRDLINEKLQRHLGLKFMGFLEAPWNLDDTYPLCILVVSWVLPDLFVQSWYHFRLINNQRFSELKGVVFCYVATPFRGRAEEEKLAKLDPSRAGHRLSLTMTSSTSLRRHSGRYTNAICMESHWRFGCSCHESWTWVLQDSETTFYCICLYSGQIVWTVPLAKVCCCSILRNLPLYMCYRGRRFS